MTDAMTGYMNGYMRRQTTPYLMGYIQGYMHKKAGYGHAVGGAIGGAAYRGAIGALGTGAVSVLLGALLAEKGKRAEKALEWGKIGALGGGLGGALSGGIKGALQGSLIDNQSPGFTEQLDALRSQTAAALAADKARKDKMTVLDALALPAKP